jgi:hypothetical protein
MDWAVMLKVDAVSTAEVIYRRIRDTKMII